MNKNAQKIVVIFFITLGITLTLTIGGLWYFSPIYRSFPQPTGPYGVGIITKNFIDANRNEIHTLATKPRALVADIYYPTEKKLSPQTFPYQAQRIKATINYHAKYTKIPAWILKILIANIQSYANPNAQIAAGSSFPVVIFSHGIGGAAFYNVYLEELASHGYVVVSVYHTYDTEVTVFSDDYVVELDPELRDMIKKIDRTRIYPYRAIAHKIWLQDLQFMIDKIQTLNSDVDSMFNHKLDLTRLGALGHSHGGAVVIDLVKLEPCIKAGIDLDGWTISANTTASFNKPFMTIVSGNFDLNQPFTGGSVGWNLFLKNMQTNSLASLIIIPDADHNSFSDDILIKWPFGLQKKQADKIRNQVQHYIQTFFDKYVK